jgi:hypothetical protein
MWNTACGKGQEDRNIFVVLPISGMLRPDQTGETSRPSIVLEHATLNQ